MEERFVLNKPVQVQKLESAIMQSDCEKTIKKKSVYTQWNGTKRWRVLIHRMIKKQQVKNEEMKRKQTCALCFVNVFKFQENKFKVAQKNCQGIKTILITKRFLGKATPPQ